MRTLFWTWSLNLSGAEPVFAAENGELRHDFDETSGGARRSTPLLRALSNALDRAVRRALISHTSHLQCQHPCPMPPRPMASWPRHALRSIWYWQYWVVLAFLLSIVYVTICDLFIMDSE